MDRILVYALSENVGGVEEYVLNLSRFNMEKECEYEYIILGSQTPYQNEMDDLKLKYYFIPKKKNLFKNIIQMNTLFRERRKYCSILYFNTSSLCYPLPYIIARRYRYRIILHSHLERANGIRKIIHLFNRTWIGKLCMAKLACSTPAAEWMFGKKHLKEIEIVPNAIDLGRFKFNPSVREKIRTELQLQNYFVLGHVGRLSYVKNQSFLLEIIAETKSEGLNYKLLLVGDGKDEQKLRKRAEALNITDRVIFYGRTNHPEDLLGCMDCFVMPSLVEGFPVTLVEAQASGLPCLVSDSVAREVNVSGNIHFASLACSPQEWLETIKALNLDRYDCLSLLIKQGFEVHGLSSRIFQLIISKE